ncbi:IPTL-CTERM sorting domain-containing protein [Candidatus Bipolaricaulota bacterium]|nr:IPTL-CTERM sorting domain-containing protein [Candidatus Bipolaricaulota bacterium]
MLQNRKKKRIALQLAFGASVLVILVTLSTFVAAADDCGKNAELWFPADGTALDSGVSVQEITPPSVCQGGTIEITITVDNMSCGPTTNSQGDPAEFDLMIYYDQYDSAHLIDTLHVPGLDGCEHITHTFTWSTSGIEPGTHSILAWADPHNTVVELNETNNKYTMPTQIIVYPYAPVIDATKTYSDMNGGDVKPDDTIQYTVVITNNGCADQTDNAGHEFSDALPAGLYATGAANASSGTAAVDGETIYWDGVIASGDSVTITFVAKVDSDVEDGQEICNQGHVHWDSNADGTNDADEPTDDPSTAIDDDPTCFTVKISDEPALVGTIDAPTLSEWAQITMSILIVLSFAAMLIARRKENGAS